MTPNADPAKQLAEATINFLEQHFPKQATNHRNLILDAAQNVVSRGGGAGTIRMVADQLRRASEFYRSTGVAAQASNAAAVADAIETGFAESMTAADQRRVRREVESLERALREEDQR